MSLRKLLLLSSSKVHGYAYLEYAADDIKNFLSLNEVKTILFIPYALIDYDDYTKTVHSAFKNLGYDIQGIHTFNNPVEAVENAQAIFIGGGNTFRLLKSLYDNNLIAAIQKRVHKEGIPYIGSSAGTNVATYSISTTNDMPIVYPPSFKALELVPFNINPHYVDADELSKHKGETREDRINQYHEVPGAPPVLGLREGCTLAVHGTKATLKGVYGAKLFKSGELAKDLDVGTDVSYLLELE